MKIGEVSTYLIWVGLSCMYCNEMKSRKRADKSSAGAGAIGKAPPSHSSLTPLQAILSPSLFMVSSVKKASQGTQGFVFFFEDYSGVNYVAKLDENGHALEKEYVWGTFINQLGVDHLDAPQMLMMARYSQEYSELTRAMERFNMASHDAESADVLEQLKSYKGENLLLMKKVSGVPYDLDPFNRPPELDCPESVPFYFSQMMGALAMIDLLIGNSDRILAGDFNPGNMLFDVETGGLNLIDNSSSLMNQKYAIFKQEPHKVGKPLEESENSNFSGSWDTCNFKPVKSTKYVLDAKAEEDSLKAFGGDYSPKERAKFKQTSEWQDAGKDNPLEKSSEPINPFAEEKENARSRAVYLEKSLKTLSSSVLQCLDILNPRIVERSPMASFVEKQFAELWEVSMNPKEIDLGATDAFIHVVSKTRDPKFVDELVCSTSSPEVLGILRNILQLVAPYQDKRSFDKLKSDFEKRKKQIVNKNAGKKGGLFGFRR
ncbi:hypothetical protein [Aureibacter tunicatorum]|uniref:Uncharacterized protein n=1 Tax=Aureibacter tunicatorum TaxID=866807 RepID=A0AAE4BU02_9BACT|nr:hypothetical protein [Aureibacter tunicatorum]MDR6240490.1 hypothetical protein [Aureibacter tunicatorum]BDD06647.1 hypothetical protein AUTU_41300 [Aureibacter tunicatorum]